MGDFKYNMDADERDDLLGLALSDYQDSIARFTSLTLARLNELINMKFADPADKQNDAPSIREIQEFMEKHPHFTAHGYAKRRDYRMAIEGVSLQREPTKEEVLDFTNLFRMADRFTCSKKECYCWFD